jgi:metal-responsive CopG/Arc/MetJ family transcriptional regulator
MQAMRTSAISLPDDLKAELERMSARAGVTEADLIREGLRHVAPAAATESTLPLFASGQIGLDAALAGLAER